MDCHLLDVFKCGIARRIEPCLGGPETVALKPDGLHRTVLMLAVAPPARLYVSDAIFVNYRAGLARPELRIRK